MSMCNKDTFDDNTHTSSCSSCIQMQWTVNAGTRCCIVILCTVQLIHIFVFTAVCRLIPSGVWSWRFDRPTSPQPAAPWSHPDPPPVGWSRCFRGQQCGAQRPQLLPCGEDRNTAKLVMPKHIFRWAIVRAQFATHIHTQILWTTKADKIFHPKYVRIILTYFMKQTVSWHLYGFTAVTKFNLWICPTTTTCKIDSAVFSVQTIGIIYKTRNLESALIIVHAVAEYWCISNPLIC